MAKIYHNGQQSQSSNQDSQTHTGLWHSFDTHGFARNEIENLLNSFVICINIKVLDQMTQIMKPESQPLNQVSDLSQLTASEALNKGKAGIP